MTNIDFDVMIDNMLARESRPKGVGRYYPSEIGGCLRKIWFSYKYPQDVKPDLRKVFELGNILHDFVVDVLKSEKNPHIELLKSELPVKLDTGNYLISGRVDDLILIKQEGKTVLVEVKSCKNTDYVKKASAHHLMQLQFYMHASEIHNGILLYVDKTNLKTKSFEASYNEAEAKTLIGRFDTLHKSLTDDKMPAAEAKESTDSKWMCRYCEYAERCGEK